MPALLRSWAPEAKIHRHQLNPFYSRLRWLSRDPSCVFCLFQLSFSFSSLLLNVALCFSQHLLAPPLPALVHQSLPVLPWLLFVGSLLSPVTLSRDLGFNLSVRSGLKQMLSCMALPVTRILS